MATAFSRRLLFFLLMLLCSFVSANDTYQVLVVHAYNQEYPWAKSQHEGFVEAFQIGTDSQVNFSVEYLDTKRRLLSQDYLTQLAEYFTAKYNSFIPDLIYVTDDNGYLFARDVLLSVFPGIPVLFSGVNDYGVIDETLSLPIRGVFEKKQIIKNLELFKEFHVQGSPVLIIGDASTTYAAIEKEIKNQLFSFPEIKISYISQASASRLLSELDKREEKYLFLTTLGGLKDDSGNTINLKKVVSDIVRKSDAIVISMEDAYLFDGVLGGYVTSGRNQGKTAAKLALELYKGKKIDEIQHVTQSPNEYIFNQSELKAHGIELPESILSVATLYNVPPSFYERHSKWIMGLLVLSIGLVAIFGGIIAWSRYHKKSERRLKERTRSTRIERYQDALLEWSAVDFEDLVEALNKATEISAKTLQITRVSIWLFDDERTMIECSDMYADNQHQKGMVLKKQDFPQYFAYLDSGRPLIIKDARTHPATSEFTDSYLIPNNIFSMLDVPIYYRGRVVGVVCHEQTYSQRDWQNYEVDFAAAIASAVSLSLEISKRRLLEKHLEHQAYHDALTGLPNRSLLMDRIEQAIRQADRDKTLFAVLFLDLDSFKQINDSLGHAAGDQVLIQISKRLRKVLREIDTIARLGGDEFTLLVSGFSNTDEINDIALKLFDVLNQSITVDDREVYVTSSIGITVYPDNGNTPEILLQNADTAMYRAKEGGRNGFQFYTRDMTERAFEKILMISGLKRALGQNEFEVFYQPQVDISGSERVSLEGLVRWRHPELGLQSPAKFIVAAEESGLIVDIDRWMMRAGLVQLKRWKDEGFIVGRLSLNLSVQQLTQADLTEFIRNTLKETQCYGSWLCLEVTESQIMKDPKKSIAVLKEISDMGIKIAVDDFGTGYSSLSYLKKLPVDTLKIDRSFIHDISDNEEDTAIVRSVIALAKSMRIDVIAEGVETKAQLDYLRQQGCNLVQGYYFSPPKSAEDISELLRQPFKL